MTSNAQSYPDTELFIDGSWRAGAGGRRGEVVNPATEEVIGGFAMAEESDLKEATEATARSFPGWRDTSPVERAAVLRRAAGLLRERADEIAANMTAEQGKPLGNARGEVMGAADMLEWTAEEARRTYGMVIPARSPDVVQAVHYEPIGPVAAFAPWNFPLNIAGRKIACALAAGCSVVMKAAEDTPASPAAFVRAVADAGLPAGVLNLVFGEPAAISDYLIAHPAIRKISFTGSSQVGKLLAEKAGREMKSITMELGGHAPVLVFADCDVAATARILGNSKYKNSGQGCGSPSRILVEESVFDTFVAAFVEAAGKVRVGNGADPDVDMGPLISARRHDTIAALVEDAVAKGAKLALGGKTPEGKGFFFPPTVLTHVPAEARLMNEEPFGPVAQIVPFKSYDEAIKEANRLPYGLASYVYSQSVRTTAAAVRDLEAGMVSVNHQGLAPPEVPFAGIKDSGMGAESGPMALMGFMVPKFVTQARG